ncbi:MAG TPA: hypothetical protein VLI69_02355 [Gammaproteobacteria bacterium]|nr:hypothetical protein [Gammaproteobacteria bacterium]
MQARKQTLQTAKIYRIQEDAYWIHFKPFVKNDKGDEEVHPYQSDLKQENCVYAPCKLHINLPLDAIPYPQMALIAHNLKIYLTDKIKEGVIPAFKHLNGLQHRNKNVDGIETAFNDWEDNETLSSSLIPQPGNDVSNRRFIHFAQFTISLFNDTSAEYYDAIQSLVIDINRIIALCNYPVKNNPSLSQSCDSCLYGHVSFRKDYFLSEEGVYDYIPARDYYDDHDQTVLSESKASVQRLAEQNEDPLLTRLHHSDWPTPAEINLKNIKDNETFLQSKFLPSFKSIAHYTPLQLELIEELDAFKNKQYGFLSSQDKIIFESLREYLTKQAKKGDEQKGEEKNDKQYPLPGEKLQKILLNEKFSSIIPRSMLEKIRKHNEMLILRDELVNKLNAYILSRKTKSKSDKLFGSLKKMTQDVKIQAAQSFLSHLSNLDIPIPAHVIFKKEEVDALIEGELGKIITQDKYQALLPRDIKAAHENQKRGILQGFRKS